MTPVKSRRVFYIPGYDPFPARKYRELYRAEGAKQAAISGYDLRLAVPEGQGGITWVVETAVGGVATRSEVVVLEWSDLVKSSMQTSIAATYIQLVRTVWIYLRHGALRGLMGLRKGPVVVAFYPVVVLTLQLMSALALALGVARLVPGALVPAVLALGAFFAVLWAWRRLDARIFAHYLMHDFAYAAQHRGAYPAALEERLAQFAHRIAAAHEDGVDEVLVIGHSTGAHLAATCVARVVRGGTSPRALSLLTLGHVMPMMTFLRKSNDLRSDLRFLSTCDRVTWVDVSAPSDACAFALSDPVHVSGAACARSAQPLVLSAAFSKTLSKSAQTRLKWRPLAAHFQYLCAFDAPGDFDYFLISGGPMTLAERFAGRSHSPGRRTWPQSPFGLEDAP